MKLRFSACWIVIFSMMTATLAFANELKPAVSSLEKGAKAILQQAKEDAVKKNAGTFLKKELTVKESSVTQKSKEVLKKKININTVDMKTLQLLDGIGEKKAQAIIAYREKIGKFKHLKELEQVPGIGEATLNKIKPFIRL